MPTYNFSAKSEADLETIIRYSVETWGCVQAHVYIDGLESLAQSLAESPALGSRHDNLYPGLRGFIYQSHILYYLEFDQGITVVRVLH